MAGNSQRQGATRKGGAKKGAKVGTGGHSRKSLEGRGPTPKAEERTYHPAYKRKVAADKRRAAETGAGARKGVARGTRKATGGAEVVAGRNAVVEALRSDVPATAVHMAERIEHDDRTREILELASIKGVRLLESSRGALDQLTEGSVHQGVAMEVPPYEYASIDDLLDAAAESGEPPLIVALDSVTDPRNLGAVLRSAGAFGAHGVLVPSRRTASLTASAWKVSAGAAARVPVAKETNLARTLTDLKKAGLFVVGLDAGGDTTVRELAFSTDPLVVVVGSEGKGLSRLVREACDAVASIPMSSSVESLNAGVAAGITLYEVSQARAAAATA
ncbi:23S rRNA (guanosine(2251)-2'-O)-methyltransferase RlmB [Isoptericola dokdonensis]|uniref:Putative TrmH family tRNA/rRNA methyltransferase n=1 Tax=Isoptericola dokdonensis DS-3 TaxID=1300344 RepID=A0A168FV52_9MICO|nr:23S rRNA (guanosine(2251)-2'-O)-methyltransferase RlmB [Isoptericola dokdonensis]ANC32566.1 Putative TrmH family tRNA/rRNA methyltransferase [Isoptericola dokdonensis DS-3]